RFDATAAIDNYDFLHWIKAEIFNFIKDIKPFFTIAEHVPQDTTVAGPEGPLDAAWHETFSKQMMSTLTGTDREGRQPFNLDGMTAVLNPRIEGFASPFNVVNYIDNHDQTRILWLLGQNGILDEPAFRRVKMGAALMLTAPGTPMLWMGQEFGESAERTTASQSLDWSLLQNQRNSDLRNFYTGLINLRKHTEALNLDTVEIIHADPKRSIIAFKRWDMNGGVVVVVANLRDQFAGDVHIANWPGDGKWHEYTDNYDTEIQGGVLNDKLAESEVKVFIKA
ncbi:MAG: alpha amylase C-terminal domain-containing protein, partial [Burkholderiales bacterium]|nr:alpha amylase C-terminal domain-containing protein [Anaerolineae bacterium]